MGTRTLATALLGLWACGGASPSVRTVTVATPTLQAPAAVQPTPFVSPYSYAEFFRAELLMDHADPAGAISAYENALGSADPDAYLLTRYSRALALAGYNARAFAVLQEARALAPQDERVLLALAQLQATEGQMGAALGSLAQAEAIAPRSETVVLALSQLLTTLGAPERALAALQRFAARGPEALSRAAEIRLHLAMGSDDREAAGAAARDLLRGSPHGRSAVNLVETLATQWLTDAHPLMAAELLQLLDEGESDLPLRLRAFLAAHLSDAARDLLLRVPPDRLGGFPVVARAMLTVDMPERALEEAERALLQAVGNSAQADEATLMRTEALLRLGYLGQARSTLAQVSGRPDAERRKQRLLTRLIAAGGAPALACALQQAPTPPAQSAGL